MKKRILFIASILCAINTVSTNAQTITAPTGQNLTIANPINVTGGGVNIPIDSTFKIGGKTVLSTKGVLNFIAGDGAGKSNTGQNNMLLGSQAGFSNTSGSSNIMIGTSAGLGNTSGGNNVLIGISAGASNGTANFNTFIGGSAGRFSQAGYNTFIGNSSGYYNTSGVSNVGIGVSAGQDNTTGVGNVFVGNSSGSNNVTGFHNTFIGTNTSTGISSVSFSTAIGFGAVVNASNSLVLGNTSTNVGIGTSAPANKLEVVSGTAGQSGLRLTGLAGRAGNLQVNAAGDVILVASGAARVAAADDANWTLTSNYLYNNSNGVVIGEGITSTPAGYKLFVSDGILTEKVKVAVKNEEDWADRVFEDNYKMMSLAQTNQYIKENKHLPGVPSTQEMIEKGNDLHKTDVILLTKIEELYRHVIKIEQENQALKKELKSLKNRKR